MLFIYTIGHSTHPIEEFIEMLNARGVKTLVDIRTIPKSKYNPQYGWEALSSSLQKAGIKYEYMQGLGGLRPPKKDSINTAWRNKSFQGYADYMQTDAFKEAAEELIKKGKESPLAIMCAEAVPWRCHRSLVGDALLVRKVKVIDILSLTQEKEHTLTPFAKVKGKEITYPSKEITMFSALD